jgi:hypothetical protein
MVADAAPVVAAELLALARGDPDVCPCCTSHPDRRAAIDHLRAESHRLGIAGWAHSLMPLDVYYRGRGWCA